MAETAIQCNVLKVVSQASFPIFPLPFNALYSFSSTILTRFDQIEHGIPTTSAMVKVQQPYPIPTATLLTKCFLPTAMNAHLPERFRGPQPRKGHQSFTDGPENDLDYKLNLDIRNYFVKQGDIAPTSSKDQWLATSKVPTHEELGETMAEVFSNKISGPYRNKSQYLKVQYSLQREDAVGSLRDAIHDFQNNPQTMDTQKFVIYDQVGDSFPVAYLEVLTIQGPFSRIHVRQKRARCTHSIHHQSSWKENLLGNLEETHIWHTRCIGAGQ